MNSSSAKSPRCGPPPNLLIPVASQEIENKHLSCQDAKLLCSVFVTLLCKEKITKVRTLIHKPKAIVVSSSALNPLEASEISEIRCMLKTILSQIILYPTKILYPSKFSYDVRSFEKALEIGCCICYRFTDLGK